MWRQAPKSSSNDGLAQQAQVKPTEDRGPGPRKLKASFQKNMAAFQNKMGLFVQVVV